MLQISRLGTRILTLIALRNRAALKGVIIGLGLCVEEEQLKWKIPGVCDASVLLSSRSSV